MAVVERDLIERPILLRLHDDPHVDFEKVLDECTETILQQVKALRQISMEFSTFASPEPLRLEPTDSGALVRETVAPYVQAPPAGVRVSINIADDLPPLRADARFLKRTLLNLVENALHAVNGEGSVDVKAIHESSNGAGLRAVLLDPRRRDRARPRHREKSRQRPRRLDRPRK